MRRFRELEGLQKGIIIVLAAVFVVFSILYIVAANREGFVFRDGFLRLSEENGNSVYSGKTGGKQTVITVAPDKSMTFRIGEKTYGPYEVKEDPTILPNGCDILLDGRSIYHGSVRELSDGVLVFNGTDGEPDVFGSINVYTGINGEYRDINGNPADIDEPRLAELFEWAQGPEAVRRGNLMMWFFGTVICIMTVVSILFADELYRLYMSFRMENAEDAIPSEWYIMTRYLGWFLMAVCAIVIFAIGLRM
ncbi:MAG: hypothetical protein K6F16_05665 [Lachnospiraceae bacterium]|nr:hypothetical protein [Lachnospiraceae bacterium]